MVKHISSGSPFETAFGYSRAVIDNDMVYVSGTTGYDYNSMELPPGVEAQANNTLATISSALNEAGSSLKDVVRVRYYLSNRADVERVTPILGAAFSEIRPAATMIIADLIEPDMKIEIEVTARIGAAHS